MRKPDPRRLELGTHLGQNCGRRVRMGRLLHQSFGRDGDWRRRLDLNSSWPYGDGRGGGHGVEISSERRGHSGDDVLHGWWSRRAEGAQSVGNRFKYDRIWPPSGTGPDIRSRLKRVWRAV